MQVSVVTSLSGIEGEAWDRLAEPTGNPFLRYAFLEGLERFDCLGERWGWLPHHLLVHEQGELIGAAPLYLKTNSYGEFVFDWSWADAWERAGGRYYPKLVSGIPYTPVTGPRLLTAAGADTAAVRQTLATGGLEVARKLGVSSLHWLFPTEEELDSLVGGEVMRRLGTQFHWFNRGYRDFEDFLDRFTAQKRKKIKRERKRVVEAGIELEVLSGHEATGEHWRAFHRFYRTTFERHSGYPTLTEAFFRHLSESMPDAILLVLARKGGEYVAGAFNLRGRDALFGRHWGCAEAFHSLHFEACYYTGIEYCIREGLARFEPGAQGEHKVSRGFEPVPTWSTHWLADAGFSAAVRRYVENEEGVMRDYMDELAGHLPFKQKTAAK
ncbi:GNAT family N-acetyltransferase [Thiohalomonas denitrificans]|uniref:Uncharacterized protein n=1 Tax=Thiohalomonas denitrificans TaxID=415747 RepID=A0A1G5QC48_9GAMM|nr:GNAT family N-acetyltransferase [Thiohalomonas denitrificans]SCZ59166.1 hypothetical protein SAMN03097708_01803 [Thiohalomonas denitrificans]